MLLFLDDNDELCRAIARFCTFQKIEGRCFQRWSEAKTVLEDDPNAFDCALIDFGLTEEETGLDIIRWIRSRYPHIRCILTSGARRFPSFKEEPPFQTFLPKPFAFDELVGALP